MRKKREKLKVSSTKWKKRCRCCRKFFYGSKSACCLENKLFSKPFWTNFAFVKEWLSQVFAAPNFFYVSDGSDLTCISLPWSWNILASSTKSCTVVFVNNVKFFSLHLRKCILLRIIWGGKSSCFKRSWNVKKKNIFQQTCFLRLQE